MILYTLLESNKYKNRLIRRYYLVTHCICGNFARFAAYQ